MYCIVLYCIIEQIGLLPVQRPFPEINFQEQNDAAHQKLLKMVTDRLTIDEEEGDGKAQVADGKGHVGGEPADHLTSEQKSASFQVQCTLA